MKHVFCTLILSISHLLCSHYNCLAPGGGGVLSNKHMVAMMKMDSVPTHENEFQNPAAQVAKADLRMKSNRKSTPKWQANSYENTTNENTPYFIILPRFSDFTTGRMVSKYHLLSTTKFDAFTKSC